MCINDQGKLAPVPSTLRSHGYWRGRFLHYREECVLRFGPYPTGIDAKYLGGKAPTPLTPKVCAALTTVNRLTLKDGAFLVKYGQRRHMANLLTRGSVCVAPASSFNDVRFGDAIRDDEFDFTFWLDRPTSDTITRYLKSWGGGPFDPDASAVITRKAREDYYIYSMSASFDVRAFDDFEHYDSCVLIRDIAEFSRRLLGRVFDIVNARGCALAPIAYIDPMTPGAGDHVDPTTRKHFRYAYQDEVRAVWLAKKDNTQPLAAHLIDIGDIRDIAELISLPLS